MKSFNFDETLFNELCVETITHRMTLGSFMSSNLKNILVRVSKATK
jgi:hypothetical protein